MIAARRRLAALSRIWRGLAPIVKAPARTAGAANSGARERFCDATIPGVDLLEAIIPVTAANFRASCRRGRPARSGGFDDLARRRACRRAAPPFGRERRRPHGNEEFRSLSPVKDRRPPSAARRRRVLDRGKTSEKKASMRSTARWVGGEKRRFAPDATGGRIEKTPLPRNPPRLPRNGVSHWKR